MIEVAAVRLRSVVCAGAANWPAARLCCEALRKANGIIRGELGSKATLKRTYGLRLGRPDVPTDLIGIDRLLADLERYPGEELVGFVYTGAAESVYTVIVDPSVSNLVACFVGKDRSTDAPY
jgi:hypothetical protein